MYRGTRTANLMICTLQNPFSLVIPYQVTKGNNAYSRLQHLLHICTLTSKAVVFTKDTAYLIQNQNRQTYSGRATGLHLYLPPLPWVFEKIAALSWATGDAQHLRQILVREKAPFSPSLHILQPHTPPTSLPTTKMDLFRAVEAHRSSAETVPEPLHRASVNSIPSPPSSSANLTLRRHQMVNNRLHPE